MTTMTPTEMKQVLHGYSCWAAPVVPEGWSTPNGYILRGPRGNKMCVGVDADGNVDEFSVRLWLAGISYGTKKASGSFC